VLVKIDGGGSMADVRQHILEALGKATAAV